MRKTCVTFSWQTGQLESSTFNFVAHSIQKKLWPHGTRAATTSELVQTIQPFFLEAMLLLLFVESTWVGEREPMTPFALGISAFNVEVVVIVLPELLKVPIGAVVEVEKREKDPSVVLGGIDGSSGSLASLRAVV